MGCKEYLWGMVPGRPGRGPAPGGAWRVSRGGDPAGAGACKACRGGGPAGGGAWVLAGARGPAGANPGPRQTLHFLASYVKL